MSEDIALQSVSLSQLSPTMSRIGTPPILSVESFRKKKGPLIDIRSPKEFDQGHWPGATNIPLFSDNERALIGTAYKKKGRSKAILLGLQITKPKLSKLKSILENTFNQNPSGVNLRIYCWRGGLRSASIGWFANVLRLNPVILNGGYKSYRRWVLSEFDKEWPINLIGGKTGSGKTSLLLNLKKKGISVIDLEGLANHKGSSFGGLGLPDQPTSEQFENLIAENLNLSLKNRSKQIWIEAESASLGKCRIPNGFFAQMKDALVIEISRTKSERIKALVKEYSKHSKRDLELATQRISKRLGPQRTVKAIDSIKNENWEEACISMLDYYDKCYEYDLNKYKKVHALDISGLSHQMAAERLIKQYDVY